MTVVVVETPTKRFSEQFETIVAALRAVRRYVRRGWIVEVICD